MSRTSLGSTIPDFADAQGNLLDIEDHKTVLLELPNDAGDLQCLRESCLVSSVSSPLFAVGKLYQLGWSCFWEDDRFCLGRQGDPETYIPIFFKHNSLYAKCFVRRAQTASPGPAIRSIVTLGAALARLAPRCYEFQDLVPGVWCLAVVTNRYIDVSISLPHEDVLFRTTLVEQGDGWKLLELSEPVEFMLWPTCMLPDASEPQNCIVFAHRRVCTPSDLGFSVEGLAVNCQLKRLQVLRMAGLRLLCLCSWMLHCT